MIDSKDLIYFHDCVKALTNTTPFELIIKCIKGKETVTLFAQAFGNQVWGRFKTQSPNKDSYSYSIPYKDVEKLFKSNIHIGLTHEGVTFFSGANRLTLKPAFADMVKFKPIEDGDLSFNRHLYHLVPYLHFLDMGSETLDGKPTYFVAHPLEDRQAYISSNHASGAYITFKSKKRFAGALPLPAMQSILKTCALKHETNRFLLTVAEDRMTLDSDCIFASLSNLPAPELKYGEKISAIVNACDFKTHCSIEHFNLSFFKDESDVVIKADVDNQTLVFSLEATNSKKQVTVPLLSKSKMAGFGMFINQLWPFNNKILKWKGQLDIAYKEGDVTTGYKINRKDVDEELFYIIACAGTK